MKGSKDQLRRASKHQLVGSAESAGAETPHLSDDSHAFSANLGLPAEHDSSASRSKHQCSARTKCHVLAIYLSCVHECK